MGKYAASDLPRGLRLESAHDPAVGMTLIKEIRLEPQSGVLDLQQTMKNSSDSAVRRPRPTYFPPPSATRSLTL